MGVYRGTTKLVILSVGVVWTAVMLRFMGPTAYVLLSDWLPKAYVSLAGWLTPPYLYLIINGIILSIAASSRFSSPKAVPVKDSILVPAPGPDPVLVPVPVSVPVPEPVSVSFPDPVPVQVPPPVPVSSQEQKPIFKIADDDEEEFVIKGPRWDLVEREDEEAVQAVLAVGTDSLVESMVRADSIEMPSEYIKFTESMEKPLVTARFSRKSVRASPEGKALRVTKSRKGETLESTWRTITEGRAMPLTRHLKKSDTWETRASRNSGDMAPPPGPTMRKAETFHENLGTVESPLVGPTMRKADTFHEKRGTVESLVGSGEMKVKREPSLGQDDLNRRVEAFIQKFNEEMRMQRQESFINYMDMVSRGADQ